MSDQTIVAQVKYRLMAAWAALRGRPVIYNVIMTSDIKDAFRLQPDLTVLQCEWTHQPQGL